MYGQVFNQTGSIMYTAEYIDWQWRNLYILSMPAVLAVMM